MQYTLEMQSGCGYSNETKKRGRLTIEITSRVIVVAVHNGSSNSSISGGTYIAVALPRVPLIICEISNWRIVDFNSTRGKIRVCMKIRDFLIPIRKHLHGSSYRNARAYGHIKSMSYHYVDNAFAQKIITI